MIKDVPLDPKIMGDVEVLSKMGWGAGRIAAELNERFNIKLTEGNITVYTDVIFADAMRNALKRKKEMRARKAPSQQKEILKSTLRSGTQKTTKLLAINSNG